MLLILRNSYILWLFVNKTSYLFNIVWKENSYPLVDEYDDNSEFHLLDERDVFNTQWCKHIVHFHLKEHVGKLNDFLLSFGLFFIIGVSFGSSFSMQSCIFY